MIEDRLKSCTETLKLASLLFPWHDESAYATWLAQTYFYVRHSTRLLALAASRFDIGGTGDALHYRFATHIAEEKKHEQLCLHDLKQLGTSIDVFHELHATRAFYEPQYYKVEHQSPTSLFGYIIVLEAIGPACGPEIVGIVTDDFGPKCASFLKVHAEEDDDHIQKALKMIAMLSTEQQNWVLENMDQTSYAYAQLLRSIQGT